MRSFLLPNTTPLAFTLATSQCPTYTRGTGQEQVSMYAETIASGTELLMGEIQDTNSSWLASRLPGLGLQLRQATLVGDDPEQYAEVITRSWERNEFTFTTGGLGPTQDDVTRETIALVLGEEPSVDDEQL